jgi:tetratricopeptide (TPR) repeat protein
MADIYGEFGDLRTGAAYALAAFEQAKELASWLQASALAAQARYELLNGNYALAESLFDKATQNYDPGNFITFIPQYVEDARNDLLMHKGEHLAALEGIDKIIAIVDRLGITQCRPEFILRRARTLVALQRHDEALAVLAAAAELCEKVRLHRVLWKIYALMSQLQTQAGRPDEAQTSRQAARQEIGFLADRCPPALRQSFLQIRAVRDVLEMDRTQP